MSTAGLSTDRGRYSHWVRSSTAVSLLANDGCAEVLGVGEREPIKCLQWRQTGAKILRGSKSEDKKAHPLLNSYKWIYSATGTQSIFSEFTVI